MNNLVRIAEAGGPGVCFPMSMESCGDSTIHRIDLGRGDFRRLAMDVIKDDTAYVVTADMPGISRDEVSVTIDKNVLTISARLKRGQPGRKKISVMSVFRKIRPFPSLGEALTKTKCQQSTGTVC
ncbi:MAG: hypothetical protein Ct9H300mP14_13930 [Gammaproteobacteria bacterium]|nr:MAG: hypothetical protein Ct9H300mP14_13930 [Gammaproteobacteria bacterium]